MATIILTLAVVVSLVMKQAHKAAKELRALPENAGKKYSELLSVTIKEAWSMARAGTLDGMEGQKWVSKSEHKKAQPKAKKVRGPNKASKGKASRKSANFTPRPAESTKPEESSVSTPEERLNAAMACALASPAAENTPAVVPVVELGQPVDPVTKMEGQIAAGDMEAALRTLRGEVDKACPAPAPAPAPDKNALRKITAIQACNFDLGRVDPDDIPPEDLIGAQKIEIGYTCTSVWNGEISKFYRTREQVIASIRREINAVINNVAFGFEPMDPCHDPKFSKDMQGFWCKAVDHYGKEIFEHNSAANKAFMSFVERTAGRAFISHLSTPVNADKIRRHIGPRFDVYFGGIGFLVDEYYLLFNLCDHWTIFGAPKIKPDNTVHHSEGLHDNGFGRAMGEAVFDKQKRHHTLDNGRIHIIHG